MSIKKQHFWIDREHVRITTRIPCQVGPVGGVKQGATIVNLSAGGLKFACTQAVFTLLLPEEQRIPGQVIDVDIGMHFQLQGADDDPVTIDTAARIIHTERLAQDNYTLGVQFTALNDADTRVIETFIEKFAAQTGQL